MADLESYPWHCVCGRLCSKKHNNCPDCKRHWSKGTPHDNTPKSPRTAQAAHGQQERQAEWGWSDRSRAKQRGNGYGKGKGKDRSESARRKGKGKTKGRIAQDQVSPFSSSTTTIPPWPSQEETKVTSQTPFAPSQTATSASSSELANAVRKHFGDLSQAPDEIQKALEKADKATTKALSNDLTKASKQVGQAAKQVASLKDARSLHRQNWLKHLRESVTSWQKQLQLFKDQQTQYGTQLSKAQVELNNARRHLQHLNKMAAAGGTPISQETGEAGLDALDTEATATFEEEARILVEQVQESLQQSITAASTEQDTMEIPSDEEMDRKNKRARSMEPFGGKPSDLNAPLPPSSPAT